MAAVTSAILGAAAIGMQVNQGIQQRNAMRAAQRSADDAMAQARRELSTNRLEGVQIPMEAYQLAQQANVAQQQQALQGLQESDPRALAGGVGKVVAASGATIEDTRQQQAKDIFDYEKMVADQQTTIDQGLGEISLAGVEGAQLAASASEQMAAAAFSGAAQTAAGTARSIYEQSDLYGTNFADGQVKSALDKGLITQGQRVEYADYINSMNKKDFRRMDDKQRIEGFQQVINPYGYDPVTGLGMSLGAGFDSRGVQAPTYSGPTPFPFENLPQ